MKTIVEYLLGKNKIQKDEFPKDYCLAFPVDKVYMYFKEHWPDAMVKDVIGATLFIMTKRDVEEYREISEYPKTCLRAYHIPEGYETIEELKQAFADKKQDVARAYLNLLESKQLNEYLLSKSKSRINSSVSLIDAFEHLAHENEAASIKELKLVYKNYEKHFSEHFEILVEIIDKLADNDYVFVTNEWREETYTDTYGYTHMYSKESKTVRLAALSDLFVIEIINVSKLVTITIEFDLTPRKTVQVYVANHGAKNAKEFVNNGIKRGQWKWVSLYDMKAADPFENFRKSIEMTLEI